MIARINGLLVHKSPTDVIVDTQGVGYRIYIPLTTYYELPDRNQPVVLNIHTQMKQDSINLFGFHTSEELRIFQLMIAVNGIGPKLAINILSGITARELFTALSQGNVNRLVNIPGVGKKMAERIILELKDKARKLGDVEKGYSLEEEPAVVVLREDALSALVNLGYKSQPAENALNIVYQDDSTEMTLDMLLKKALKILAGS